MSTEMEAIPAVTEDDLLRDICRSSFSDFVKEFWHTVVPEKLVWNWHMEYICDTMQSIAERVFKGEPKKHDLIINICPSSTKSTIVSIMFPAWVWTRMPSAKFINASYTEKLAYKLAIYNRDVIRSDLYRKLYPEIELRSDMDTKGYFGNTLGGTRYSVGIGGSVIGMHAHFITIDDPIDPEVANMLSEEDLNRVNRWCTEIIPARMVDSAISVITLIMQRLHQNDPTGHLLDQGREDVRLVCIPAEITDKGGDVVPPRLKANYVDGLMDPVRLPRNVLRAKEAALGLFAYVGQFLQNPTPRGGALLKIGLIKYGIPPTEFERVVRYWDKAGTQDDGAYTCGAKVGKAHNGKYWLLGVIRGQWSVGNRERVIQATAMLDGPRVLIGIEQEPASGGKESAHATVVRLAGYHVVVDRPSGDKAERAVPVGIMIEEENFWVPSGAAWVPTFLKEAQFFPRSKYKDQIDAVSGAFALLTQPRMYIGPLKRKQRNDD